MWPDLLAHGIEAPEGFLPGSLCTGLVQREGAGMGGLHTSRQSPERCSHPGAGDVTVHRLAQASSVGGRGVPMAKYLQFTSYPTWTGHLIESLWELDPAESYVWNICVWIFTAPHKAELFSASHSFLSRTIPCHQSLVEGSAHSLPCFWTGILCNHPYKV